MEISINPLLENLTFAKSEKDFSCRQSYAAATRKAARNFHAGRNRGYAKFILDSKTN
jgi:hypothetical protein